MKIVLCANTSGYLYNFRGSLISRLQQAGHTVYALAPRDAYSPRLSRSGARWIHLPLDQTSTNPVKEFTTLLRVFFILRRIQADFLLTFTPKCNMYIGLLAQLCPFVQIATVSGLGEAFHTPGLVHTISTLLYRASLRRTSNVFFQNQEDLRTFLRHKILSPAVCERIPGSGVDLSRFTPCFPALHREKQVFLMFGRLVPQKRYDLFLQAAADVTARCAQRVEFQILGIPDPSRAASKTLFETILTYHKQGIITYLPDTDDVVPVIHQADVVVLPSEYHEGVPKSLLEALACGKPVITTDWKGCRDTVDPWVNGILIPRGDLRALQDAIRFFLQADRATVLQMGIASRRKAETHFDEQIVLSTYINALHKREARR